MIIAYCIFIPILLFISGFAKVVMDLSEEGKIKFKPSRYWIKAMSSPNKWKEGDSRKGENSLVLHVGLYHSLTHGMFLALYSEYLMVLHS